MLYKVFYIDKCLSVQICTAKTHHFLELFLFKSMGLLKHFIWMISQESFTF